MGASKRKPTTRSGDRDAGRGLVPYVAALLALVTGGLLLFVVGELDDSAPTRAQATSAIEAEPSNAGVDRERGRIRASPEVATTPAAETVPANSRPGLGTIEGRVVDHAGSPVSGALVRPAPRWGSNWVETDGGGAFRLVDVTPADAVALWCLHPDLRTGSSDPIDVVPDGTTTGVIVKLPAPDPVEVVGRVLDPDGNILPAARTGYGIHVGADETANVALGTVFMQLPKDESPAGRMRAAIQAQFAMADRPDGLFRYVVDRTARTITVHANHADFMYAESEYTILGQVRSRIELDVVLPPERWVEGRVIDDDDAPVEGVEIRFKSRPGTDSKPLATTDARGRFRFRLDNANQDAVRAYKSGYVRSTVLLSAAGDDGIVVRVRRQVSWHGRVVFPDGTAVQGANIHATPAGLRNALGNNIHVIPHADSDDEGRFSLPHAFELAWQVTIRPGDHLPADFVPVRLDAVRPSDGPLEIQVERGLAIEGRVVDDTGRPVEGASLGFRREDGPRSRRNVTSGAEGRFRIGGLRPGGHNIHVAPADRVGGFVEQEFPDVPAGTKALDLVVASGGSIRGVVVDADGRPVARRGIIASRADRSRFAWPGAPAAATDAHGRFEITGLQPVPHRLVLDAVFPDQRLRYLEGGEDIAPGTSDLRLVLSHGPTLRFRVLDATGRPLANQELGVRDVRFADPGHPAFFQGRAWIRTNSEGEAGIGGLHPTHAYDVEVDAPGHARFSRRGLRAGPAEIRIQLETEPNDE